MKKSFSRYFHLVFVGIFFTLAGYLAVASPLWADENLYLKLAKRAASDPLKPFDPMLGWVPHPPLGWYLFAVFSFMPRLASILTTALCTCFLYHVSRKLYGDDIAKISVVLLVSTFGYMLFSAVAHLDGPLTAFMAMSLLSFLAWLRLGSNRYLLFSGLNVGLASMTKYTAVPILFGTFILWLVVLRGKVNLSMFFKALVVYAVSLVPLALWSYGLYVSYGDFVHEYSEIYGLFPTNTSLIALNLIVYAVNVLFLWGFPFVSWIRKHPFDSDVKLLLIYSTVLFVFFVLIAPMTAIIYPSMSRYLLPIVPATTIISAKSLKEEKPMMRFIILILQFVDVTLFASLILLYPPFISLSSAFYSQLLRIIGVPTG